MIAVSSSGKSFRALAAYLASGRTGEERDRVAWSSSRNLPTNDPELAATFMRATAAKSDRIEKPVYHIVFSFDPSDSVDRAAMERVANRALDRLGLSEHQIVMVAHQDREHPHLHVFVNRVHPETGKAWERWKDQPLIQQVLREEEIALGLRRVPGSLSPGRHLTETLELFSDRDHEAPNAVPAMNHRQRAEPRSKIESLKRDLSMYEEVAALSRAHYAAKNNVDAARACATRIEEAADRWRTADESFDRALRVVYKESDLAKQAFVAAVEQRGVESATATLQGHPEHFGPLRTVEARRALGLMRSQDDGTARAAAPEAARLGLAAAAAHREMWSAVLDARARRLEQEFERDLAKVYERPAIVREHFEEVARRHGGNRAIETLVNRPTELGQMRAPKEHDQERPGETLRRIAETGLAALRAREQARSAGQGASTYGIDSERVASERREAQEYATRRGNLERDLRERLKRHPRSSELQRRISQAMEQLLPHEARQFKRAVTAPHLALASTLKSATREVLLGPDHERQR